MECRLSYKHSTHTTFYDIARNLLKTVSARNCLNLSRRNSKMSVETNFNDISQLHMHYLHIQTINIEKEVNIYRCMI